jgi:hypothetical protein
MHSSAGAPKELIMNLGWLKDVPFQVILVLAGLLVFVLGAGEQSTFSKIFQYSPHYAVPLMTLGSVVVVAGFIWAWVTLIRKKDGALPQAKYPVTVAYPRDNASLSSSSLTANGTISTTLPGDYELWMLRKWPGTQHRYPVQKAGPDLQNNTAWTISGGYIGGPGLDRTLEMWLVGPDGSRLLNFWMTANDQHNKLMSTTQTPWGDPWNFPGLSSLTSDMTLATALTVQFPATTEVPITGAKGI